MNRVLAATVAGAAVALVAAAPAVAGIPPHPGPAPCAGTLHSEVNAVLASGPVGVLAEVSTPTGSSRARAGVADINTRRPVPFNGEFRIGSATKTFVATVVLRLVDERRLSLDDTVARWLPGVVAGNGNDGSRITVRQLLQHTSGIPNYIDYLPGWGGGAAGFQANRLRTYTAEQLVALAMAHPPLFAPGSGWSYSNTNYILAGMIIQRVTGRTWQDEVRDRIIRPLHLQDTIAPGTSPFVPGPHADGYSAFGGGTLIDTTVFNPSSTDASAAIISSTQDLNRFYRALLGGRLLSPARLADMRTTVPADQLGPGLRYGLGLGWVPLSCGGGYYAHPGDVPGYQVWDGVTADGRRAVTVSVTGDEGPTTQQRLSALADNELCGTRPTATP
jgi:D-alanyl-D-alanine carboxypeptidase